LSRLRHRLKDQLFVRTPAGMTPTPRAEQLARPVRRALDELQLALEPDVFSPATAGRIFVVALNNFGAIALAAPVVSECLKQAPRIRVSLRPSGTLDVLNFLERGELDLVISELDAPADRFAARNSGRRSLCRRHAARPPGGEAHYGYRGLCQAAAAPHVRREKHANPPAAIDSNDDRDRAL
jgi:DNA-binding transcriptional LysR family regulator